MLDENNVKGFPVKKYKILFKRNKMSSFPLIKMLILLEQYNKIFLILTQYSENINDFSNFNEFTSISDLSSKCFAQGN